MPLVAWVLFATPLTDGLLRGDCRALQAVLGARRLLVGAGRKGRTLFWDFLKNLSLGAGFLLLLVGTNGAGLDTFLHHPLASTHPYRSAP